MNYKKSQAKDASRAQFRGIWAAITTPFTGDLALDEAGLRANMRYLTGTLHVDGVFCTGVMGEFWSLTKEERKRIVEIVAKRRAANAASSPRPAAPPRTRPSS